jgi:hypothetical protein
MHWDVVTVRAIAPLALQVQFADGTAGSVRFEASHLQGVFQPLRDPQFFQQAFVDDGVVAWPGNVDLAPDAMYDAIKASGEWLLR